MDIAIGLPATIPGTEGTTIIEWAKRADAGPFSSLGIIDRIVFPNYEPMVTLAACAAVTDRVRLTTTVLLAPLRDTALLAKQAASVDALSNGRLTLGLGVGAREDDFTATGAAFHERGRRFDRQLEEMYAIWTGGSINGVGPIGPRPVQSGGPPILISGYSPVAVARLARWGIGFISGGLPAQQAAGLYAEVRRVWREAGREGEPRIVGSTYFGLGTDGRERGGAYLRAYYGDQMGGGIAANMPNSAETVRQAIAAFRETGADELFLWPTIAELDQVDELARIVSEG